MSRSFRIDIFPNLLDLNIEICRCEGPQAKSRDFTRLTFRKWQHVINGFCVEDDESDDELVTWFIIGLLCFVAFTAGVWLSSWFGSKIQITGWDHNDIFEFVIRFVIWIGINSQRSQVLEMREYVRARLWMIRSKLRFRRKWNPSRSPTS